ncbi:hypothetical protein [Hymenobacter guriensis]|uniref:Uncharacterized protein n=1 Tax=Hymenobacter guriensis TaxID=2793065 RepID=A0ABS0KVY7_9BACT|nr:hypothetical protein [Hymenobacter guriensis]MBG8552012.1 hypothetical protein [Hymenobacter guriensis]
MRVKQGRKYLAEYTDAGLTAALLDAVETRNEAFVDGLADRKEVESTRANATQARIRFANGLYRQLVQLCATGEACWRLTDAAKPPSTWQLPLPPRRLRGSGVEVLRSY